MYYDADYWKATGERAIKTFVQVLLAVVGTDALGALTADWNQAFAVAAMSAALSVLTSLAGVKVGPSGPSLTSETTKPVTVAVERIVEVPVAAKKVATTKKRTTVKKSTTSKK